MPRAVRKSARSFTDSTMSDPRVASFSAEADKTVAFLQSEFAKLQTGRANAALVEHISVEAYGQRQELRAVAGISVGDAKTLQVQPWDRSIMHNVEKALQTANLGASIQNDGTMIRVMLPPMTEERRKMLVKMVHEEAEKARIQVRTHRQKSQDAIREDKDEDVRRTQLEALQKAVDAANAKITEMAKKKEEEVMKI